MEIKWIIEEKDIGYIKKFVDAQSNKSFVRNRLENNIDGPIPNFKKELFWDQMISCILTTQQQSGPDKRVTLFCFTDPFPLNLKKCLEQTDLEGFVVDTITNGHLRFAKKIGSEVLKNFKWLNNGGWQEIAEITKDLIEQRRRNPQLDDKIVERKAAKIVIDKLKGFGPKQSRHLWLSLGYTRFEIPIDSRVQKWFNEKIGFPIRLSAEALSDENYYNFVLDGIQKACQESAVYPCILDAAIFASYDSEWPERNLIWWKEWCAIE